MFVENGCRHARGAGVAHPDCPSAVVFEGRAEDETLLAMLRKSFATLGLFVGKRLYADGDKRVRVVVVCTIDMGVC